MGEYRNLTFNGGGVKIFSSVGTVKILEQEGVLDDIENVSGASAGAVLGLMVCLNMTADEIGNFFLDDFDPAIEIKDCNKEEQTKRFFEEFGRYPGEKMRSQIEKVLEEHVGDKDITFEELHELGYKNPYIVVTDVTDRKTLVFSYKDTPDAKVIDAIHASAAFPLFFTPVISENEHLLSDGGIMKNYPIDIFDSPGFLPNPHCEYNYETLGIFLGSRGGGDYSSTKFENITALFEPFNDMDHKLIKKYMNSLDPNCFDDYGCTEYNIYSYISDLSHAAISVQNVAHHKTGEIFISQAGDVQSLDIHISREDRMELMSYGEKAASDFFAVV